MKQGKTPWRAVAGVMLWAGWMASAAGDVTVVFEEDAPRDRFVIANGGPCDLPPFELTIDLAGSTGRLIFDTVPGGAGENVAQPLQVAEGGEMATVQGAVEDGAEQAQLLVDGLAVGARIVVTVDVDDRVPAGPRGQQMIAGSEVAGAMATLAVASGEAWGGTFDAEGRLVMAGPPCGAQRRAHGPGDEP
ncbi:MAG: aggregation factor core protein MAFp3, isoform C [Candidatus Competibacterales bacterium]